MNRVIRYWLRLSALVFFYGNVVLVAGDSSPNDAIKSFMDAATQADGPLMYTLMSTGYKSSITEEYFLEKIRDSDFSLISVDFLEKKFFKSGGFFVVKLVYEGSYAKRNIGYRVIFMSLEEDRWRIENFPFTGIGLIEYSMIPRGLKNGIYK